MQITVLCGVLRKHETRRRGFAADGGADGGPKSRRSGGDGGAVAAAGQLGAPGPGAARERVRARRGGCCALPACLGPLRATNLGSVPGPSNRVWARHTVAGRLGLAAAAAAQAGCAS